MTTIEEIYKTINNEVPKSYQTNSELLLYCLKNKRFDLVFQFTEEAFTTEIFNDYVAEIIAYISNEGQEKWRGGLVLPFPNIKGNQRLFDYCLNHKLNNLIPYFFPRVYTKEIINSNKEIMLAIIGDDLPIGLSYSIDFLNYCLEQQRYDLLIQFESRVFSEEIIEKYSDEILARITDKIPYNLKKCQPLFNKILEIKNYNLLIQFDSSFFTKELIEQQASQIIPLLEKDLPYNLESSSNLLEYYLENKIYDNIFDFNENAYTDDIVNKYSTEILSHIITSKLPTGLSKNKIMFQKVLDTNRYELLTGFKTTLITEDVLENYGSLILESISDNLPYGWNKNQALFNFCLSKKRFDILINFNAELFTAEIIQTYGQKILKKLGKLLSPSQASNANLFNLCLLNERFDLIVQFDQTLFTEEILKQNIEKIEQQITDDIPYEQKDNTILFNHFLSKKKYELIVQFDGALLTKEILEKHGSEILAAIGEKISARLNTSQALFDYCLLNKKYNLLIQFSTSNPTLLTKEIIKQNKKAIVNILSLKNFIPHSLKSNKDLFDYCLSTKQYNLVLEFNKELFTTDIVNSHTQEIITAMGISLPYNLSKNEILFNYCLNHQKYTLLLQFDNDLLNQDFIEKHGDILIQNLTGTIPYSLKSNNHLFKYCLVNKKYDLVVLFNKDFFTTNIVEEHGQNIINTIGDNIPYELKGSSIFLNYLLKNNRYDLAIKFNYYLFTNILLNEYGENILKYLNNTIPDNLKKSQKLLIYCLSNQKYELAIQFAPNVYTEELIEQYGEELISWIEHSHNKYIPESLDNNEYLLNKYIEKNRYDMAIKFMLKPEMLHNEKLMAKYIEKLGISKDDFTNKVYYLYSKNDEILNTLIPELLSKKYSIIDIKHLEKISVYKDIQVKLLDLNEKEIKLISNILNLIDNEKYDMTAVIFYILQNLKKYSKLIETIDYELLTDSQLKNLISILQSEKNTYNIQEMSQLSDKNFSMIIENYYVEIDNKIKNNRITIEELKEALLEKKYGLSIEKATFLCERYCHNMNMLKDSNLPQNIYYILEGINNIYKADNLEYLEFLYITSSRLKTDFYTTISLESSIRKEYAKMYNETLYQVNESHRLNEQNALFRENRTAYEAITAANYKGVKPKIYIIDGDFNLQIHVLGAYRIWERPQNFKDDWQRPKISHHGICTSYIGNNQIANARIRHPVYGFSEYEESALLCAGNQDLFSDESIAKFATAINKPYEFYPPKEMIDYTRHTHNEMVLERRLNKQGETFKRTPNYVIYFVDDINNLDNFSEQNILFEETVQAAVDQNIPIVIVDRLKYAKSESQKCQTMLQKFKESLDFTVLEEVILTFMNNSIGCINYLADNREYYDYFNGQKFNKLYSEILTAIKEKEIENKVEVITKLIYLLQKEYLKLSESNSPNFTEIKTKCDFTTKIQELETLKSSFAMPINQVSSPEEQEIIDKKRKIILYFYEQPLEIREKLKADIEQKININEIITNIESNKYTQTKSL